MPKDHVDWLLWVVIAVLLVVLASVVLATARPLLKEVLTNCRSIGVREVTAYHCVENETDSSPSIGAFGRVADDNGNPLGDYFACNFLPKGTKIIIPALFGKRVFVCMDRMNKRFPKRIDILMPVGKGLGLRKKEVFVCD